MKQESINESVEKQPIQKNPKLKHAKELHPQPFYLTVVRPSFCQNTKTWSTRVLDQESNCIKLIKSKNKEFVVKFWLHFMKMFHNVKDVKL